MSNLLEYKGYFGAVEFSSEDSILYGKLIGVNSLISYEGENLESLKKDFESAVDDYLELSKENGLGTIKLFKGSFN